ncbi:molybdenum cofactor guanylyltransferase [Alcaligenaceae bacterium]|nr:molybdenum cofactor guanylyltransferase [Alcaligenaceae bacterium]
MIDPAVATGLILAGGRARRMQSPLFAGAGTAEEKGLLMLNGEPLVAHAHRFLAPRVGTVLVSANRHQERYAAYGKVISDDQSWGDDAGPLVGVATALRHIDTPWIVVLPVDVIRLPLDLIGRLAQALDQSAALIAYATTATRGHPLCMVVHASLMSSLGDFLSGGDRKVGLWQALHQAVPVLFPDDAHAFFNINTPDDLAYANQLCKS